MLDRSASQVEQLLRDEPGVADVRGSSQQRRDEVEVRIDRERAQRLGISAKDAADAFGFTLGGMPLPRFREGGREVDSWLALRIEDRAGIRDLRKIAFTGRDGDGGATVPVRLADIAELTTVRSER